MLGNYDISKLKICQNLTSAQEKKDSLANFQPLISFPIIYVGMCIEPPSPYEMKSKYLKMEYKDMKVYVNIQREKWKTYRCTIMCDGWTQPN